MMTTASAQSTPANKANKNKNKTKTTKERKSTHKNKKPDKQLNKQTMLKGQKKTKNKIKKTD